jgi:cobalt-zinc-cadmium efflux system outer membrane protein
MTRKGIILVSALLLGGCLSPVRERVDQDICHKADLAVDLAPRSVAAPVAYVPGSPHFDMDSNIGLTAAAQGEEIKPKTDIEKRLKVKEPIPGSEAKDIKLTPPPKTEEERKKLKEAIDRQFLQLKPIATEVKPAPGPEGRPLTLSDLQKLALTNSPLIRQAAADVEAAKGGAQQSRMYPNPSIGFVNLATMGPGGGPINGGYLSGVIKGPGKIKLAFDAANVDVKSAELALRRAESDLRTAVRDNYFALLSAQENLRVQRAMVKLTDEVYKVMVELLHGGQNATYETMQVRVTAMQTRINYLQAHNRYLAAWKQLAATMGLPGMPLTEVAGRIDSPLPKYNYEKTLAQVLSFHTDALTAKIGVEKYRSLLQLARLGPYPDFSYVLQVVEDNSPGAAPSKVSATLAFGVPLPIFDRNQGGIRQAQGALLRATEESHRVRSALTQSLADAFERYENTRIQLEMYQKDMLPNQVQAFRATVMRHSRGEVGQVMFTDLVNAEQSLVTLVTSYLGVLHDMWFAAVDIAALLQTPDLFQADETLAVAPIPDLEHLLPLDCLHPCPVLTDPALRGGDGYWPRYDRHTEPEPLPTPREVPARQNQRNSNPIRLPERVENVPAFLTAPMDSPPSQ